MRVDHVSYAAEHDGARATAGRLGDLLGVTPVEGGVHPRFGTRNMILPLAANKYVEVVEVLDHPASDKAAFGQAVRERSATGGGWLGWVVALDNIARAEKRLGREAVEGSRHRPDGVELRWKQIGVNGLRSDPQVPFFIEWEDMSVHPSAAGSSEVTIDHFEIAGDPERVREWLGPDETFDKGGIAFTFVAPHGTPGLLSVTFETPSGKVTV